MGTSLAVVTTGTLIFVSMTWLMNVTFAVTVRGDEREEEECSCVHEHTRFVHLRELGWSREKGNYAVFTSPRKKNIFSIRAKETRERNVSRPQAWCSNTAKRPLWTLGYAVE